MSVSRLNQRQGHVARVLTTQAALLGYHHASEIHYTQGSERWSGINKHLIAAKGQFPREADCSAFVTWCLWNSLRLRFGLQDIVNGSNWDAGYTGTLAQHGREVHHVHNVIHGDVVLYGPAPTYEHTAIVVGHRNKIPQVVSHGSELGPYLLPYNYRSDANMIRRYI